MDRIAESIHKNGIVTELDKFWMDTSKVGKLHLNQNVKWTSVSEY